MLRYGGVFCSIILVCFSFPNMFFIKGCPELIWAALVPFLAALDCVSMRVRVGLGMMWGFGVFLFLTAWMRDIGVFAWLGLSGALFVGPVIFSAAAFVPRGRRVIQFLYWPGLWVLSEVLRTWILGGFSWSLGYALASSPELIWSARWGGGYCPAWIIVCVNVCIFLMLRCVGSRFFWGGAAAGMFLLNAFCGRLVSVEGVSGKSFFRAALIQPNILSKDKTSDDLYDINVMRHFSLSKQAVEAGWPRLVVWPETAFADDVLNDPVWRTRMEAFARNSGAYFLIGSALLYKETDLNSALLLSPEGRWVGRYDKQKLVPFSEYAPKDIFSGMFMRWLRMRPHRFSPGRSRGMFVLTGEGKKSYLFGTGICSEEAYSAIFRDLARHGASFVVVLLNDGWFSRPEALAMHAQNGVFRAVETGLPVLRVANTGRTVAFDSFGRTIKAAYPPEREPGMVLVDIPFSGRMSPYARFGDIFLWFCTGVVVIIIFRQRKWRRVFFAGG